MQVEERLGSAGDSLRRLLQELGAGSIDIAFIDADKRQYWAYFEQLLEIVRPGGLIIADNVLFYGKVCETRRKDAPGFTVRPAP
jgi:predicted O-methyltransferase YrrM